MRSSVFFPLKGLSGLLTSRTNLPISEQPEKAVHNNRIIKCTDPKKLDKDFNE